MTLLSKFGMCLLRNLRNAFLLLMVVSPNFTAAETRIPYSALQEAAETRMPYSVLQEIEFFCRIYECQDILINEANITDDGYPDFETYLAGSRACDNRGCPVLFSFSENGEYKTIPPRLTIPLDSIEWQQSNGQSSPASFMVEMGQDCKPLWVWTGSNFDYSQCVSE